MKRVKRLLINNLFCLYFNFFHILFNGDSMKINFKKLIIILIITFIVGCIFIPFVNMDIYKEIVKPKFAPPSIVFPIVWGILFILMSISLYIVTEESSDENNIKIYAIQLIVNSLWNLIFFGFKWFLVGSIWIILLIVLVVIMTIKFYKVNKIAGLIQIPYIIWLLIAFYLNFSIFLLN